MRQAQIKADIDEIKLKAMSQLYCEIETVKYYISFFRRGIIDGYSEIDRQMPNIIECAKISDAPKIKKIIETAIKLSFEDAMVELEKEMNTDE